MQNVLTKLGYEVQIAADGAEAVVLFENAKDCGRGFDAVLLDLTIPGRSSQEVLAARLLNDASAVASRVPPKTTPSPGQWIYSKLVQYEYPQGTSSDENWYG